MVWLPPNEPYELFTANSPGPIFAAPFEEDSLDPAIPALSTGLRCGRATPTLEGNGAGFGWRKIMAKHGWGNAEAAQTQEALIDPLGGGPFPSIEGIDRWTYRSPSFTSRTGFECWWTVVAERAVVDDDVSVAPGIETAYGFRP